MKRKNRDLGGGGRDYGSGQINAYPPPAAGANPAAGAMMMSLAEELLTKKGLSLKDLQVCCMKQLGPRTEPCAAVHFLEALGHCMGVGPVGKRTLERQTARTGQCRATARSVGWVHAATDGQAAAHPAFQCTALEHRGEQSCNVWVHFLCVQEDQEEYAETGEKQVIPRSKRPVTKHWNWVGLAICLYYCAAALYYFIIRGTYTLNMGYLG